MTVAQVPQILRRSIAWIVVPTAVVALGAGVFVNVVSPRYTGEAKVILESREPAFTRTAQERPDVNAPIDEQAVASQVQVMMSRDIAREAVKRLKLVGNPEFDATADGIGPVQQAMILLGIGPNPFDRPAEDRVIESYFDHLLVYSAGKSRIITVEFRARDAKLAAEAANTVAQLYIASLEADKVDTARYASSWLGSNITALRRKVAEAEGKVEAYRAKHGLVATTGATGQPLTAQQLGELSSQLSQARVLRADIAGRLIAIRDMIKDGRSVEITDIANNEVLRRTVDNRITVRAQLALESRTLLPAHPRIKELKAQLEDLDAQIKIAAERAVRILENDAKVADARVTSLQAAVDGQQDVVVKGNASEIELRALEREAKVQREQLESYLGRFREASARDAESAAPADARIVSRAVTPTVASFPKKLPIVGFATLVTLLLAIGGVLARALLTEPGRVAARSGEGRREAEAVDEAAVPAPDANPFLFPEAMPTTHWSGPAIAAAPETTAEWAGPVAPAQPAEVKPAADVADAGPAVVHAVGAPVATAPRAVKGDGFDLAPLIARLSQRPVIAGAPEGRTIVMMETEANAPDGLTPALADAFGRTGSVLVVDFAAPASRSTVPGLTDVVGGDADFVEVIQADGPGGAHHVATGIAAPGVLLEEPRALAFTLEAMAEAYEWVICRLHPQPEAAEMLSRVATLADSVVIASNADPADDMLADLYATAMEAGAGQVLIAQDRPTAGVAPVEEVAVDFSEFHLKAA
nr:lipopolysaccharide biosynthesis protein [Methylobacterium sp. J-076]